MNKLKHIGPDIQKLYTYKELPIGDTAIGLPPVRRKTGLWRYMKPAFEQKTPPCHYACPLSNWVQRFLDGTGLENLDDAWWALKLENPFPGVCGRVCYHPCEVSCNRKELDGAVSIQAIERYLADHYVDKEVKPPIVREKQGKKTAVVGAGPAGLSCAYFLALLGYEVTVFEARNELGGIPQMAIPGYRLPKEVLKREIQDILSLGIKVRAGCRVGEDMQFSELLEYDAVFLATGAHREGILSLPGEDLKGVYKGLDFLTRVNLGDSIDPGDKILVIGGGNVAIDVVRTLLRLDCQPILLYRRTRMEMPAFSEEIDEALEEGVQIQYLLSPTAIHKSEKKGLSVECTRMKIEGSEPDGRSRVVALEGENVSFQADKLILATGEAPDLYYLPEDFQLTNGLLWVSEWGQTKVENVFAGGDIIDQPWSVSDAIGSAKRAAIAMDHYLKGDDLREISKKGAFARTMREHLGLEENGRSGDRKIAEFQDLNVAYVNLSPRYEPKRVPPSNRTGNFKEIAIGMSNREARDEAKRCLSCGACRMCGNCYLFCPDGAVQLDYETGLYAINYDYCKGCGVCENECLTGIIIMNVEGEG